MKSKVDKLDVDKLVPVPVDLSKQSDVVKNDVVKKGVYNAKIKKIQDKIPDIINWATNASPDAEINEVKGEIPTQQTFVGLQDLLKTSSRHGLRTSSKRLQRNNFLSSKTSSGRLEDVLQTHPEDVLKTSGYWAYLYLTNLNVYIFDQTNLY